MVDIPGSNLLRETITSSLGNSVSDVLKVAGQGKTILLGMQEALVNNMEQRLGPLMKFAREQYLIIDENNSSSINQRVDRIYDDLFLDNTEGSSTKGKHVFRGKVLDDDKAEETKIKEQLISSHKSLNLYKSVEDKVEAYLSYVRGNEGKIKNADDLSNLLPHELDLSAVETWHNNRGNVRMARAAINEMQTFAQAQNALIYHLIDCKLVGQKFRDYFEDMATVMDLFEPMSQSEGDKFRLANVKWEDAAKEYEIELEKKYSSFTLDQKKLAVYFTTQAQSAWNEYLGAGGANALHKGVGSAFANILQFRTFMMREVMEETTLNLLKAYENNEEIDIERTAQATNFDSAVKKGRTKLWKAREYFEARYGIKDPGENASREEVHASSSQITKAMLIDSVLHAAHAVSHKQSANRGWGLLESNRKFMHCLTKLRIDFHPAFAYRADGDGAGKSTVGVLRPSRKGYIKDETGVHAERQLIAEDVTISETGEYTHVKDMMYKFEFSNEHFFKSFMDQAAKLKSGSTSKSLIEETFNMMTITSLTHYDAHDANAATRKFLSTNGYNAYDKVPEFYILPQAHRPHIDIAGDNKQKVQNLKDKVYYQMLMDLPKLPEPPKAPEQPAQQQDRDAYEKAKQEHTKSLRGYNKYINKIKKVHEEWKGDHLKRNSGQNGAIEFTDKELKLLLQGADQVKTPRTLADEISAINSEKPGPDKNSTLYLNIPNRKTVMKLLTATMPGMPFKEIMGRGSNMFGHKEGTGIGGTIEKWATDPNPGSRMGKILQNIDHKFDVQNARIADKKNTFGEKTIARLKRFGFKALDKTIRYAPVLVIGGAGLYFFPAAIPYVVATTAGVIGYKAGNFSAKKLLDKLNNSRIAKVFRKAVSIGLGLSAGMNTHQAMAPDTTLLSTDAAALAVKQARIDPNRTTIGVLYDVSTTVPVVDGSLIKLNNSVYKANKDLNLHIAAGDSAFIADGKVVEVKSPPGTKIKMAQEFRIPFKFTPNIKLDGFSKEY